MSDTPVIEVQGVSKSFRVYAQPADRLVELLSRRNRHREFVALRDVTFRVGRGETVGIVGRNGSGKSTLLQVIAGTLQATTGHVTTRGRVSALLELGSGFNPDFSGRENVYLNGQVLGLRRHEIESRFERIERFADIGDFIDQPVRTYSSGMLVRLAFSVAINTDPDILIIDEALAVGDEAFQRKCFAQIERIKSRGATILFVSHTAASVVNLCDRALLLDAGELLLEGEPKIVVAKYQSLIHAGESERIELRRGIRDAGGAGDDVDASATDSEPQGDARDEGAAPVGPWPVELSERFDASLRPQSTVSYATDGAGIRRAAVRNARGDRVNVLLPGQPYVFSFEVEFESDASDVEFGMSIKSVDGIVLFGMSSHGRGGFIPRVSAGQRFEVRFSFSTRFQPGTYFFNAGCQGITALSQSRDFLHRILDVECFRVDGTETDRFMVGFYDLSEEPAVQWTRLS